MEKFSGNKKESGVNRVVGIDTEKEEEILEYFKDIFEGNTPEGKEKEKSTEEKEIIVRMDNDMSIFLKKYGVDTINIPNENIHIIDSKRFTEEELRKIHKKFGTEHGFYSSEKQSIVILKDSNDSKLSFYHTIAHEMLHIQGFYSYQKSNAKDSDFTLKNKNSNEELSINVRRSGFSIGSVDGKELFFDDLNESIITELEILFEKEFIAKWPELQDEVRERKEHIEYMRENNNNSVDKKDLEIASFTIDDNSNYTNKTYAYYSERRKLKSLVDGLYKNNSDQFDSRDEVFKLFVEATMSGRIMEVARLIEKTFGKGSFRMIGELTSDKK